MAIAPTADYPAQYDVTYSEHRDRLTVLLRIILGIPIMVVVGLVSTGIGYLALGTALMLLFRKRYPQPWFQWHLYLGQLSNRANAYLALLVDEYPSTTEHQRVTSQAQLNEAALTRWMPLVKWILAIPHYVVLVLLAVAAVVVIVLAWFIILITGRYPRGMFNFIVGIGRWAWRVNAYVVLLSTDRYPPFSLK